MLHYYHPRDKRMHNYALTNNSIELPNLNNSHTNKVCSLAVKKIVVKGNIN